MAQYYIGKHTDEVKYSKPSIGDDGLALKTATSIEQATLIMIKAL